MKNGIKNNIKHNMIKKRFLSVFLAAALIFTTLLSGCSGSRADDNVLTLYLPAGSSQWPLFADRLIARFPEIDFEINYFTGIDQTDYMISRINHDDTGDLVFTTTKLTDEEQEANLLDLSGYDFVNNYDTGVLESVIINDRVYQLPFLLTLRCIAYNKTIFEEHGWREPKTYDEMISLIKTIREEAPDITPLGMSLGGLAYPFTLVTTLSQCEYLSTIDGAKWEREFLAGEGSVAEGWADGLAMTAGLIDAGAFDPEKYAGVWDGNAVRNDFAAGGAAMMILWSGQNELLEVIDNPENKYEYGLMPFFGTSEDNMCVGINLNCCWGINKHLSEKGNEAKLANALKVMEWLSSEEGFEAAQTSPAMMSPFKNMGESVAPQFCDLWNYTADGYRAIPIYAGFESIVIECGQIMQDAMMAGSSDGAVDKFIKTADAMYKASLDESGSDVIGHCAEDIKGEALVQLMADIVADTHAGDFALVTTGDVADNNSANRRGACGVLYEGPIGETDLQILRSDSRNIQVLTLTGAQVTELIRNGKTTPDNNYQEGLEATWTYTASGIDITEKKGEIKSVTCNGEAIDDNKTYRVAFLYGDYPVEWVDTVTIEDTGITQDDAIRSYIKSHDPLMAPKTR